MSRSPGFTPSGWNVRFSGILWFLLVNGMAFPHAQAQTQSSPAVFRSQIQEILIPLFLTNHRQEPSQLQPTDIQLYINKQYYPHFRMWQDSQPISVSVAFDQASPAVRGKMVWIRNLIRDLIHLLGATDRVSIIAYGSSYDVLVGPTSDRLELMACIDRIDPQQAQKESWLSGMLQRVPTKGIPVNRAAIALDRGAADLQKTSLPRKCLILISDGDENLSKVTLHHVQNAGIVVFSVYIPGPGIGFQSLFRRGAMLEKVCNESGGFRFSLTSDTDPHAVAEEIVASIQQQYLISFPPDPNWSRSNSIAVEIRLPDGHQGRYRKSFRFTRD